MTRPLAVIVMHGILGPVQTRTRCSTVSACNDVARVTTEFLSATRRAAVERFHGVDAPPSRASHPECHTEQTPSEATPGSHSTIILHVSDAMFSTWAASGTGSIAERQRTVREQMQLVLQDLADHDAARYFLLTDAQCQVYDLDLVQLVTESLGRTTFCHLGLPAVVHWEGTLVQSCGPPAVVLVVSAA